MPAPNDLRLLSFPSGDATFRDDVGRAGDSLHEDMSDVEGHRVLLDQLRPRYRSVEIVTQNLLAQHELVPIRVWYVFRDGRVRPFSEGRERLYTAIALARKTIDASRTAMDDARTVARSAGYEDPAAEVAVGGSPPPEAEPSYSTRRTDKSV